MTVGCSMVIDALDSNKQRSTRVIHLERILRLGRLREPKLVDEEAILSASALQKLI